MAATQQSEYGYGALISLNGDVAIPAGGTVIIVPDATHPGGPSVTVTMTITANKGMRLEQQSYNSDTGTWEVVRVQNSSSTSGTSPNSNYIHQTWTAGYRHRFVIVNTDASLTITTGHFDYRKSILLAR